jgi:hypothetical protein
LDVIATAAGTLVALTYTFAAITTATSTLAALTFAVIASAAGTLATLTYTFAVIATTAGTFAAFTDPSVVIHTDASPVYCRLEQRSTGWVILVLPFSCRMEFRGGVEIPH